ncbi:MAG: NAD(P)-dependent oxidoreductase [Opitutaceae bacterium]|jgi:3-hydroxyisobutyrate dehydrogenase|nr:NAD(P)-dependent oxidoreductase [Opitutaceae bacterium]
MKSQSIGVIGLGIIGGVWARHYHEAGVLAGAWNRTAKPDFPQWLPDAEAVARAAGVVQVVVADPPAVRGVIERIAPALGRGKVVVQSSTIDPESSSEFKGLVEARGARYLEAPFTGSKPAAEQRKSVFYLGGEVELVRAVEPLLSLVSEARYLIGDNRQAATLKLAMNLNLSAQMQALAEALTMVRRSGVSDEVFFTALKGNAGCSGLALLKEPKLRAGEFSPQFSVKHMLKDMRLASLTRGGGDFPVLGSVRECLERAAQAGYVEEDFTALIKLLG